jgi:ribosomal protein S18 acetylase RimI-like enzyme
MSPNLSFKIATQADIPKLVELINSAYRGEGSKAGWTTEADLLGGQRTDSHTLADQLQLSKAATDRSCVMMLAQNPNLIGCVYLEKKGDSSYLGMLTISPTQQNSGLGRILLLEAEKFCSQNWQVRKVHMTVISIRSELLAWYQRRGYQPTGEKQAFPYGDEKYGIPKRTDLEFLVLEKSIEV